jgi:poly(glycerol-phosphate) alpha-glucosyltransferase
MNSLGRHRGGLTKAVYERVNILSKSFDVYLVVLDYQAEEAEIFEELKASGALSKEVKLLSFFSYHMEIASAADSVIVNDDFDNCNEGLKKTEETSNDGLLKRYFKDGVFVKLEGYDSKGILNYVDHHSLERPYDRVRQVLYDKKGKPVRSIFFKNFNEQKYQIFYNKTGKEAIAFWVNKSKKPYRYIIFHDNDAKIFENGEGAKLEWLVSMLEGEADSFLLSDEPSTIFALDNLSLPHVKKVAIIHTVHFKNNQDSSEGYKAWLKLYLERKNSIDRFVFLTKGQMLDFRALLDNKNISEKLCLLPHPAPAVSVVPATVSKRENIVIIARLDGYSKRVDEAIVAFSLISDKVLDINLHIYGIGPKENELKSLVASLGLEKRVEFKGYTANPLEVFSAALYSVLPTRFEGFGLVIVESMACGCPVISYDVKYGPCELIEHGEDGFLIKGGDVKRLSKAMLKLAINKKTLTTFSSNAKRNASDLSIENWKSSWVTLLNSLK